ncbi:PLDc N-terminal domain-containing protein [Candidatus Woesearchaeota archaeon]|nr:PLDc N-terminal domain-containing protein [Candidatus Woesearchaeota archaeon]
MLWNSLLGLGLGFGFFMFSIMALIIFVFVFWIWMLVDCLGRKFKGDNEKLLWALVIIFGGIIGSTIYYFMVKNK